MNHTHRFPAPGIRSRSIGEIRQAQCSNCLAIKIDYYWDVKVDNKTEQGADVHWERRHKENIIEDPRDATEIN